jgi:hypothetical protein
LQRSDAELVTTACGGDIDSFRELYERYHAMAVGIARGRLSDLHLAEDAAQEAFAVACRRLHSLRDFAEDSAVPGTFRYLGKEVKLGSGDRIVCWYKLKSTGTYRAVYGDLTVKDVEPKDLPLPVAK